VVIGAVAAFIFLASHHLMFPLKSILQFAALHALACSVVPAPHMRQTFTLQPGGTCDEAFISRVGTRFETGDGTTHKYIGMNFWQLAYVAAVDHARLLRELDNLVQHKITILRITAMSEGEYSSPLQVVPAMQPKPGVYQEDLVRGLDLALAEMSSRGMRAVMVLNNMWSWSGGFAQYVVWANNLTWNEVPYPQADPTQGDYFELPSQTTMRRDDPQYNTTAGMRPRPNEPDWASSWDRFQFFVARFYTDDKALEMAASTIEWLLTRKNTVSGVLYANDPTIFAWQLANEPRAPTPKYDDRSAVQDAYIAWVESTSALLKRLAPCTMVSVGSEGKTPYEDYINTNFSRTHAIETIDFGTFHIWPENWGWYDPLGDAAHFERAMQKARDMVFDHVTAMRAIGKPLMLEEFGLARDGGSYDPTSPTERRQNFYQTMLKQVEQYEDVLQGLLPWAFSGEARPRMNATTHTAGGGWWAPGDSLLGDPPHEHQGWYGNYNTDVHVLELLQRGTSFSCSSRYDKCGGKLYKGPWCCEDSMCEKHDEWYWQCVSVPETSE